MSIIVFSGKWENGYKGGIKGKREGGNGKWEDKREIMSRAGGRAGG